MPTSAEKRAKIIATQVEREKTENPRAMPASGKNRSNWAASHPVAPRRRWTGSSRPTG